MEYESIYRSLGVTILKGKIKPPFHLRQFRNILLALITFGDCEILAQYCSRKNWKFCGRFCDNICNDRVVMRAAYRSRDIRSAQILANMIRKGVDPSVVCAHDLTIRAAIWTTLIWRVSFDTIFPWRDSDYLTEYSDCMPRHHAIQLQHNRMQLAFDSRLILYCKKYEPIVWRNYDDLFIGNIDAVLNRAIHYRHIDDLISFGMLLATTRQPLFVSTVLDKLRKLVRETQGDSPERSPDRETPCVSSEQITVRGIIRGIKECIYGFIPLSTIDWSICGISQLDH